MDYEMILSLCELRIGNSEIKDLLLQFIMEAEELILNYINATEVPDGCKMVWVSISCDLYKYNNQDFNALNNGDDPKLQNISGIKIDDAEVEDTITPAYISSRSNKMKQELDLLKNYRHRLHPFRKMRWVD